MYLERQVNFTTWNSLYFYWSDSIVSRNFPPEFSTVYHPSPPLNPKPRIVSEKGDYGKPQWLRCKAQSNAAVQRVKFTIRAMRTFGQTCSAKDDIICKCRACPDHEIQLMPQFRWAHTLRFNFLTVGNSGGGGRGTPQGPSERKAFWRANNPRLMMDYVLLENALGKGHRCCIPFPPNKCYSLLFLKLNHVPLFLESESQKAVLPITPLCSHSVFPQYGPWEPRLASAFPMMLTTNRIQTFSEPPSNFILIISSFCQAEKLFSQIIPQSHSNFEILFPVFLLTWFATSNLHPPLSISATPYFLSFLNSISSNHSPICSYTSIVLSIASWCWKGIGYDIPSVFISHLRVKTIYGCWQALTQATPVTGWKSLRSWENPEKVWVSLQI